LTAGFVIGSFCYQNDMQGCLNSTAINFLSGFSCLFVMIYIDGDYLSFVGWLGFWVSLSYGILVMFPENMTNMLVFILNTACCVIFPLDTTNKVLRNKDVKYINMPMHIFGTLNTIIWLLYTIQQGATAMVIANASGILFEMTVVVSYLYAQGIISKTHPAYRVVRIIDKLIFEVPYNISKGTDFGIKKSEIITRKKSSLTGANHNLKGWVSRKGMSGTELNAEVEASSPTKKNN